MTAHGVKRPHPQGFSLKKWVGTQNVKTVVEWINTTARYFPPSKESELTVIKLYDYQQLSLQKKYNQIKELIDTRPLSGNAWWATLIKLFSFA